MTISTHTCLSLTFSFESISALQKIISKQAENVAPCLLYFRRYKGTWCTNMMLSFTQWNCSQGRARGAHRRPPRLPVGGCQSGSEIQQLPILHLALLRNCTLTLVCHFTVNVTPVNWNHRKTTCDHVMCIVFKRIL